MPSSSRTAGGYDLFLLHILVLSSFSISGEPNMGIDSTVLAHCHENTRIGIVNQSPFEHAVELVVKLC